METYKLRSSQPRTSRKVLLPVSFGSSSVSLLQVLDAQIAGQYARMGWSHYELVVVNVQIEPDSTTSSVLYHNIKSRFDRHTFVSAKISDSLSLESIDWSAIGFTHNQSRSDLHINLEELLASLPSATARSDLLTTLLQQLLVSIAKQHNCTSILFGHSTTRLATKVLTSTASGRGFTLPWQVSDGLSPYGIHFSYPMRDLFTAEIITYSKLVVPSLSDCIVEDVSKEISVSSKNTTIDDLMSQYFTSIESTFPSIVSNVVRTSSKLKAPDGQDTDEDCGLCGLPVELGTDGIFGWGGDQCLTARIDVSHAPAGSKNELSSKILCYGCSRSVHG